MIMLFKKIDKRTKFGIVYWMLLVIGLTMFSLETIPDENLYRYCFYAVMTGFGSFILYRYKNEINLKMFILQFCLVFLVIASVLIFN